MSGSVTGRQPQSGPITTVSNTPFAAEDCAIEVYPFEGNPFAITRGQIRAVTVSKSLQNGALGTVSVQLAPGGPEGAEDPMTWSQVITPMSRILVGMSRGADAAIVLDGVVTSTGESQFWSSSPDRGSSAARSQGIQGADFAWFFRSFNWFSLTFYGLVAAGPANVGLDFIPSGLVNIISQGMQGLVDPVELARFWYQKIMVGEHGVLNKTFVPYAKGTRILINNAMSGLWEKYPDVKIPSTDYFMADQSTWMEKMLTMLPWPWYEFFVTTCPKDAYKANDFDGTIDAGQTFTMQSMPNAEPAGPQIVARVTPIPTLLVTGTPSDGSANFVDIRIGKWMGLPLLDFSKAPFGFISSSVSFSSDGARNFYALNPTAYNGTFGGNSANSAPFIFVFATAADVASVQRYGFRPDVRATKWMWDPTGIVTQGGFSQIDAQKTVLKLLAAQAAWFHPLPLMASAAVTIPLAPKILIGTRFRYAPFKDGVLWDFYIEGYQHNFVFGGVSTTTLQLSRGLPSSIYQGTNEQGLDLLKAIYLGNARRDVGDYLIGLPKDMNPALQIITTLEAAAQINSLLINTPMTPQAP